MADAGRVIAGSAKGVRLRAPGAGTRPLADRVKQTLFAILEPELDHARVLDLFAGSGAGGIEALSRGAASATFVEKDQGAAAVIDANLRAAGLDGGNATVIRWDVVRWLGEANAEVEFDLVLVDPPYAETDLLTRVLEILGAPGAPLAPDARVVAKHFWRDRPPERIGRLALERDRRFGETALTFYRRTGRAAGQPGERMTVAVYPGSFDPITNGHLDVVARAAAVFDLVVIAVLANPRKQPFLEADERVAVIREALAASTSSIAPERVAVESFDGLTVDLCGRLGAGFIVRGLRAISDFETEMLLAHNNRRLAPGVDTVFFMTSIEHSYVASSLVKEIATFGGDVSAMIPPAALAALRRAISAG